MSELKEGEAEIRRSPCRPTLGYNSMLPITVSGDDSGVVSYLRRLAAHGCEPDARGRWSHQDLVWSATRLAVLGETEPGFWTSGGTMWACRISSRFGEDDLFFEVVDGVVKQPEAPGGWQLTPVACNPDLELVDHPRFSENPEDVEVVEDSSRVESVRWKNECRELPQGPSVSPAVRSWTSDDSRVNPTYGYIPTPQVLSAEERARRADIHLPRRKIATLGAQNVEVLADSIVWNSTRVAAGTVSGLCWRTDRETGRGWIRLRAGDQLFEAGWDNASQPDAETAARQLVGFLLSELRKPVVEAIRGKLLAGESERIGDVSLERSGLRLTARGLFGPKPLVCAWKNAQTEIEAAAVSIKPRGSRLTPVRVGLDVENAFALHFLPARMLAI